MNGNINIHNNNYQISQVPQNPNANNGNLLDVFTEETQQDIKAKDLLSSIQQAYTNPQQSTPMTPSMPMNSARPNMSNNLYNTNQNNFFNANPMSSNMNAMNMNTMNSMNGMYMNNNMYSDIDSRLSKIERRISRLEARVNHLDGDNSSNITYEDNSYSSNMYMV